MLIITKCTTYPKSDCFSTCPTSYGIYGYHVRKKIKNFLLLDKE